MKPNDGGQIRSLLALLSYFGRARCASAPWDQDPADQSQADFGDQAEAFANKLADTLEPSAQIAQARARARLSVKLECDLIQSL